MIAHVNAVAGDDDDDIKDAHDDEIELWSSIMLKHRVDAVDDVKSQRAMIY